ncbi:hypothetical protein [Aeromicrobium sp.]|uniref:hypothetical protein n=1 Tax=Aeromicrobium sp. TaxID=1871063 RepID=UPI0019840238|nr:hypothetical protein [Aeromicrobium sp.]MBC7630414.1 hypothetical protein [Aeromicrobium sp.]
MTKLDACGIPDAGQSAVVVSKRVSSVTIDEVTDSGTNIRERNFGDELTITDDSYDQVLGYSGAIALCGVDPALISVFTGQPVVQNASGDIVGFDANTGIDLDSFGFAIEVWSKIAGGACDASGRRKWGYTVFPFFKGGRLGGFSFENAAVQFSITGAQTRDGSQWGVGPFRVDRGVSPTFTPSPLFTPLTSKTHYRNQLVTLDPPVASCGAFPITAGSF